MGIFCIKAMALSPRSWQQGMPQHQGQLKAQALVDTVETMQPFPTAPVN
jgi:hypothetical protein